MSDRLSTRFGIMVLVVLPVLSLVTAAVFWLDPDETASFGSLLDVAVTLVVLGPSVLGLFLVWVHAPLTRWFERRVAARYSALSLLVGAGLGYLLGAFWSLFVFWGHGVALLGLFAGLLYGLLAAAIGNEVETRRE